MKVNKKEIIGILLFVLALLSMICIIGYDITEQPSGISQSDKINTPLGIFGIFLAYYQFFLLGYGSIAIPIIMSIIGYVYFANKNLKSYYYLIYSILLTTTWISVFISFLSYEKYAGIIGNALYVFISQIFGSIGAIIVLLFSLVIIIMIITQVSIYSVITKIKNKIIYCYNNLELKIKDYFKKIKIKKNNDQEEIKYDNIINENIDNDSLDDKENSDNNKIDNDLNIDDLVEENIVNDINDNILDEKENETNDENIQIEDEHEIIKGDIDKENLQNSKYFNYKLPQSNLLNDPIEIKNHSEEDLKIKADQLSYALNSFGVSGNIVKISPGPIITLFEIEPAEGVRVSKFTNLSEDLSRIMGGKRVRIIAPIPGSKSVGVELPNEQPSIVYLKSIVNSQKYINNTSKLKIALGKTTTGDAFFFELNKMPHLLVAGATGSGKSVCINIIIISILYNAKPDEVKFILMDPKKVELTTYKSLVGYHLITAPNLDEYVMTTSENSVSILNSAITEMERRFQLFSETRVRNLEEYQVKQKSNNELEKIPYLVVIIDELADLMMTSGRAIEEPITRLAQKARAVGIHLIVATQRPSVDVITGLIKSNFPARISFQVSSKVDSRTIIDQIGAEKLLGKGDMLFLLPGSASPIRLHNALIDLDEIEKIMSYISSQPKPSEIKLPEIKKIETNNEFDVSSDQDEYLIDAAKLVVDSQQASVSLLQRRFRIGYSRAGRLIDELESLGIVSGYSGSKAREVLVDHAYLNEVFGE